MPSLEDSHELVLAGIRELKDSRPDLESLLDYCRAVLQAQEEARSSYHPGLDGLDLELGRERISQGAPFLAAEDVQLDWELFDGLFDRIGQISRKRADAPERVGTWSLASVGNQWHDDLLEGLLADESLLGPSAERFGIARDMFTFLACQTVTPFLVAYAEKVHPSIDETIWLKGRCPVCGGEPLMGKLAAETGRKLLQCHLCRTQWPFKRLECPFCGNSDQKKLRFFFDRDDPARRVEVCDACKAYLKTVDARTAEKEMALLVENLATIHLDLVAEREGFHRDTSRVLGP